jgi:hypothetical protein
MAATKPSWRDVKQAISHWSEDQLRGLVQDLYRLNTANADFLHARLLPDTADDQLLDPYKRRIREAICPEETWHEDVLLTKPNRNSTSDRHAGKHRTLSKETEASRSAPPFIHSILRPQTPLGTTNASSATRSGVLHAISYTAWRMSTESR